MGSPELGRVIPVNSTETHHTGLEISAVGETYKPRNLDPTTTRDHEGIHAGLGNEGEVELVSIVPGPGYRGITKFRRPNALAAMGPHAVGAHGTSWDVMIAHHMHGNSTSLEGAARHAVNENHAEIVEISDELERKKVLSGREVDAARERARMKKRYGEYATAIARSDEGEEVRVRVKVEGDKTVVPKEIVTFSTQLREKQLEKEKTEKLTAVRAELAALAA